MTVRSRARYLDQSEWLSPTNIDNTGIQNVSDGITDWLAATGNPGDLFRLRSGSYWIPQGIRIGKSLRLDLNGATLFTGTVLGDQDPDIPASLLLYPPLWNDWDEPDDFKNRRVCINVQATDVTIYSSVATARVQGAARGVAFRGGFTNLPTGCDYTATLEGQHAIRLGGGTSSTPKVKRTYIDLNNMSLEFVQGDGIYINDETDSTTIVGHNLGEDFLGGHASATDDQFIEGHSGQGATVSGTAPDGVWVIDGTAYPGIHHVGRHGIAADFSLNGLLIDGVAVWRTGRAFIDLEAAGVSDVQQNIEIRNTECGIHTLLWIAGAGTRQVNNVNIHDNICYETLGIQTTNAGAVDRYINWTLERNRTESNVKSRVNSVFEIPRIDGLDILANHQLIRGTAVGVDIGTGTGLSGASTDVTITPVEASQFKTGGYAYRAAAVGTANQATVTH